MRLAACDVKGQTYVLRCEKCSVGLKDPNGRLVGKGWKLATTHPVLSEWMHLPCACSDSRAHVACEGKLTRESAYYTDQFAKRVVSAILHGCEHDNLVNELLQPLHTLRVPPTGGLGESEDWGGGRSYRKEGPGL